MTLTLPPVSPEDPPASPLDARAAMPDNRRMTSSTDYAPGRSCPCRPGSDFPECGAHGANAREDRALCAYCQGTTREPCPVHPGPTPMEAEHFTAGARVTIARLSGYVLHQNRPMGCRRYGCKCGRCNGTTALLDGTSRGVVYYADNSIEAVVDLDDGTDFLARLKPPSGDPC